jgi:hypothetical protein
LKEELPDQAGHKILDFGTYADTAAGHLDYALEVDRP